MMVWKQIVRTTLSGVDFLDDKVRSRAISISILFSVFGPVAQLIFGLQESSRDNPLILFVLYAVVAIFGFSLLIPTGLGNGIATSSVISSKYSSDKKCSIFLKIISIISCSLMVYWNASFAHHSVVGNSKYGSGWFYLITVFSSAFFGLVAVTLYLKLLIFQILNYSNYNQTQNTFFQYKQRLLTQVYQYLPQFKEIIVVPHAKGKNAKNAKSAKYKSDPAKTINDNKDSNHSPDGNKSATNSTDANNTTDKNSSETQNENQNIHENENNHNHYRYSQHKREQEKEHILKHRKTIVIENEYEEFYLDHIEATERELHKGWKYLLKQFLWPSLDLDIILKKDCDIPKSLDKEEILSKITQVVYPARLYGAVYIGLLFVLGILYLNLSIYKNLDEIAMSVNEGYSLLNSASSSNSVTKFLHELEIFLESVRFGLAFGTAFGTIWGIYSCLITFRAWKKKVVYLRLGIPTFRINSNNKSLFAVWWTSRFMGTTATYFGTGALLSSWIIAIIVGLLSWSQFWEIIYTYREYLTGYLLYYLIDYVGLRWYLFGKYVSDEKNEYDIKSNRINFFTGMVVVTDFLFGPLAITLGIFNVLWYILIALFKFMRPDVNIYPRGLETVDYAFLTYIASVRVTVEREIKFVNGFDDQNGDDSYSYSSDGAGGKLAMKNVDDKQVMLLRDTSVTVQ